MLHGTNVPLHMASRIGICDEALREYDFYGSLQLESFV